MKNNQNYFLIAIILIGLAIFYYTVFNKSTDNYTLLSTELNNERAFNVKVRVSEKLSDERLKSLAKKVKDDIHALTDIGVVFFYLSDINNGDAAWAAVDFNPEISVRNIGLPVEDDKITNKISEPAKHATDCFGLWIDKQTGVPESIIRIRKDEISGYVVEYISSSEDKPSELASPLIKSTKGNKTIFTETENSDYFIVGDNGDLACYDKKGFITTCKKLK